MIAQPKFNDPLVCVYCTKLATCIGRYENMQFEEPACDDCCGHACEDGHCEPIEVNNDD